MKRITVTFSFLFFSLCYGFAQDNFHELNIGDKVPDLIIDRIHNSPLKTAKLSDFKGKVVIIDFWATFCVPCIAAMPRMDSLQQKFHDQIQILAVTSERSDLALKKWNQIPSLKGIQLPIVCDDKKLRQLFPYNSVPHEIIIDQNGVLIAITDGAEITEDHISSLIKGNMPEMHKQFQKLNFDYHKPFFMKEEGEDIQYHYLITAHYDGLLAHIIREGQTKEHPDTRLAGTSMDILGLYRWAFLKKLPGNDMPPNRFILLTKDTVRLQHPKNLTNSKYFEWIGKNTYCIDIIVPPRMSWKIYDYFKIGLDDFFNLNSKMEKRQIDCWVLKTIDSAKIRTKSSEVILDWNKQQWKLQNVRVKDFVDYVNFKIEVPLLNETDLSANIDLVILPNFSDMKSIKSQLNSQGLDIVLEKRDINMIILSDRP